MVIALLAATLLFFGGCTGYLFGATVGVVDETFGIEDTNEGAAPSDISNAGGNAMFVALLLFIIAGLAKLALRTSLALLVLAFLLSLALVATDYSSLFAITYYFAIVTTAICICLLALVYRQNQQNS